jgi:hypothetical protein
MMRAAARRRQRGLLALLRPAGGAPGPCLSFNRGWAANAAPLPSSSGDEAEPLRRRLAEMEAAGWKHQTPPPAPGWPSPADAARFLSGGAASTSSSPPSPAEPVPLPTLPWREAVRMARDAGLGADPLTDGFG